MPISAVASGFTLGASSSTSDTKSLREQQRQAFKALFESVKSGDVGAAQQALTDLEKTISAAQSAAGSATGSGVTRGNDFAALATAIKSGDAAAAQKALATLQTDSRGGVQRDSAPRPSAQRDQFTGDLAKLFQSVDAGDVSAAQQALKTLTADAQALYSPRSKANSAATQSAGSADKGAVDSDFQALLQAVQAGDTDGAQKALTSLKADIGVKKGGGHHGHHGHGHHDSDSNESSSTSSSIFSSSSSTSSSTSAATNATDPASLTDLATETPKAGTK
ncbi:MAG: hypothetical protein M3081_07875 [Gemmatimonadota bacterium]|nr:hypothetical protein [Gemmatimonadota bacterium]